LMYGEWISSYTEVWGSTATLVLLTHSAHSR
jgi:hypothetical protein